MYAINIIRKLIFYSAVAILIVGLFSLTIGQKIPVEFKEWKTMQKYYELVYQLMPVCIILTLTGTIDHSKKLAHNLTVTGLTLLGAILCYFVFALFMFQIGFGTWVTEVTYYERKSNSNVKIEQQIFDVGALGYAGSRIVEIKPLILWWQIVKPIDTASINKTDWVYKGELGKDFRE